MKQLKKDYCSKCKKTDIPLIKYSKNKYRQYYQCRDCNNERRKKYYKENKDKCRELIYRSIVKHHHKQLARVAVNNAVRKGEIKKPSKCEDCHKKVSLQGHHEDYSQPLVVQWLCVDCHCLRHKSKV